MNTEDESLARTLDAAARIKKRKDQLRPAAQDLDTRVASALRLTV